MKFCRMGCEMNIGFYAWPAVVLYEENVWSGDCKRLRQKENITAF